MAKKLADKFIDLSISVGILALIYLSVFFIGRALSTKPPTDEPVQIVDVDVPDLSDLDSCNSKPLEGNISKFFPNVTSCEQAQYNDYNILNVLKNEYTPSEINTLSIIENGKKVRVNGVLSELWLYIESTVEDIDYSKGRKNAVFFIVDGGDYQGYLRASRASKSELSGDSQGVFLSQESPKTFREDLMREIPISTRSDSLGSVPVTFANKLNKEGLHLVYSYVSKPTFGKIIDMSFAYKCEKDDCSMRIEQ